MDIDRFGRYLDIAENVLTAGSVVGSVVSGLNFARGGAKRAREEFELPQPKRLRFEPKPLYHSRMPYSRVSRRRNPRTYRTKTTKYKRGMRAAASVKRVVRTGGIATYTIPAANNLFSGGAVALSGVNTTDLQAAYRLFRMVKVVLTISPRVDPGNSGTVNNQTTYIAAASDPENVTAPANLEEITSYDNSHSKWVPSGSVFKYTFYPKAVNVVGNAGSAAYVGSYATNPWLALNAAGVAVPHNGIRIGFRIGTAATLSYDAVFEYHFDVKGMA